MSAFDPIYKFERELGTFTGAPFVVMTDCCTHAIELCLRYEVPNKIVSIPARTYISIPMTLRKLGITYVYEDVDWVGEYQIKNTRVWDSARKLSLGMYRPGQFQCLSFGYDKPLEIGHGGAILLDNAAAYRTLIRQRYDGRDLDIVPWQDQQVFEQGYHYRPTIEDAVLGSTMIEKYISKESEYKEYPDLKKIIIK